MNKLKIYVKDDLGGLNWHLRSYSSVYMVYDANVAEHVAKIKKHVKSSLPLEISEAAKTMDTVLKIDRWLLQEGADRKSIVLAVGGGTTSDLAGFAASIYRRGIAYANVPTTLLAQVDASIGGKTGANLDSYKNMLGVIRQPEFTYICPRTLDTLPRRDFISGAAEMLKTFIIADETRYEEAVLAIRTQDSSKIGELIEAAAEIKAKIVRKDETEQGLRRVLNLGHTYGHAIEWLQLSHAVSRPLTHGEAVAIGIVQAAKLSEQKGYAKAGLAAKIANDFQACGLPTALPCAEEDLEDAIKKDKKSEGGKIHFVMIRKIGKVKVVKI
ncbi:MAG: 3-dehydroquinate synthase [Bacteroidales bacterium]|nr:3-dehydroquinate synthase [Bacteroidales bacterium]